MRILLFGDGPWATKCLTPLCDAGHEIVAVVLRAHPSETGLATLAQSLGVPTLRPAQVNAAECVATIAGLRPDVNLSIAYDQIFGSAIRATASWFLNVHAGKLPEYRGRNIINWAIINGETEIGVTVHLVDHGIDTGDILLQRILPIAWTDTYGDVLDRIIREIPSLVVESLDLIGSNQAQPRAQGPGGTYYGGRREGDEWIDWSQSSADVYNKIRGITHPGPGARTMLGEESVIIWRAAYDPRWPRYRATPGEVVGRAPGSGAIVKTGDSTVLLQDVQVEGRSPEVAAWPIGVRLGVDAGAMLSMLLARADRLQAR
ncbi:MAG TPA: methionyl-tRNA formyltransferase [Thermoanaerobaculia bacterium]